MDTERTPKSKSLSDVREALRRAQAWIGEHPDSPEGPPEGSDARRVFERLEAVLTAALAKLETK